MRTVVLATVVGFVATLLVGATFLAFDTLVLGNIDPKWGGPWDNFTFGFWLLAVTSVVEAAAFFGFAAVAGRGAFGWRAARFAAAATMSVFTILLWPPKARSPVITACLVAALSLFVGAATASWRHSRSIGRSQRAISGA